MSDCPRSSYPLNHRFLPIKKMPLYYVGIIINGYHQGTLYEFSRWQLESVVSKFLHLSASAINSEWFVTYNINGTLIGRLFFTYGIGITAHTG